MNKKQGSSVCHKQKLQTNDGEIESRNEYFIYSRPFMIKAQILEISKICPAEIEILNIKIENRNLPTELTILQNDNNTKQWIRGVHIQRKEKWSCNSPPDVKRITTILNKLSDDNYDKFIEEAKTFNYVDPVVVSIIFKRILAEPIFCYLYAKFCKDLIGLHDLINELCILEFKKSRHKDLGKFIGELYKVDLIDLNGFIDVLLDDINDANLEILCKIIITVGFKNPIFKEIIEHLNGIKNKFSSRYKFMILDIVEGRVKN